MRSSTMNKRLFLVVAAALLVSACGAMDKIAPGRKVDYKKARTTDALEVPPTLSSSTINDAPSALEAAGVSYAGQAASGATAGREIVLPTQTNIRVERDGNRQWLVVNATAEEVWPNVREFWMQEGFLINKEDPQAGILETGWAENRADIPSGFIRGLLGKVIDGAYSAATRDQYRVRLERTPDKLSTEIYLTHRGMEEVITGAAGDDDNTIWKPRPSDPELEAEMIKRLMVYLGVEEKKASALIARQADSKPIGAVIVTGENGSMLLVQDGYSRVWRRTGVALDRVGFAVEDRDRAEGIYYVRYSDPLAVKTERGLLSKLVFWSSDDTTEVKQYQIVVVPRGSTTHLVVNNAQGEREHSSTATRILTLLEEQLR